MEINILMAGGYALVAIALVFLLLHEGMQRHLAAWLISRAYFLENVRAERLAWRERAAEERARWQRELGVQEEVTDAQ